MAQTVKPLAAMRKTQVQSLGRDDALEKEMATHSSTLSWEIPRMEEPDRLQSMELQRVATRLSNFTFTLKIEKEGTRHILETSTDDMITYFENQKIYRPNVRNDYYITVD